MCVGLAGAQTGKKIIPKETFAGQVIDKAPKVLPKETIAGRAARTFLTPKEDDSFSLLQ